MFKKISSIAVYLALLVVGLGIYVEASDDNQFKVKTNIRDGKPVVILNDGQKLIGEIEIINGLREAFQTFPVGDDPEIATEKMKSALKSSSLRIPLPGGYSTIFSVGNHYVGGCVKRTVSHASFIINKKGGQVITDLHVAAWRENGRICVGVYVSPQGWCTSFCSPSYRDIVNSMSAALVAIGLATWLAYAIAEILAPFAFVALGL